MTAMTANDVARLLGRAAFGATEHDFDVWVGRDYADLVEVLLTTATTAASLPLPDETTRVAIERGEVTDEFAARRWWLERMRTSPAPLLERMTLLWHGHFATGVRYPPDLAQMAKQNQTLRTNALGNLFDLVTAMTVDPAMLLWLNGFQNCTPKPNENYAREFFELFTLGKLPQVYTERDIREAARAFTGWSVGAGDAAVFTPTSHDHGRKRILHQTVADLGDKEHERIAQIALGRPVSYRFFAYKLVTEFAYVPTTRNLLRDDDPLVAKVAKSLLSTHGQIADAVRTLLLAPEFRNAPPSRRLVRPPVLSVVHAAKALGVQFSDDSLVLLLDRMGQTLFDPPNVGGWPVGREWVSAVTALARYDAGLSLYRQAPALPPLPASTDVDGWARRLGLASLGTATRNAVNAYLRRTATAGEADKQAGVLALLLSSPDWVVF